MKKIICFLFAIILIITMSGCTVTGYNGDIASKDKNINSDFVLINGENNLYYHRDTKIVYWIGSYYQGNLVADDYVTSFMTPYYAPNGKPYMYDLITNALIEIE